MVILLATAAAVTIGATLAVHLGLTEAIAKVVAKICKCNMCTTFWGNMIVLALTGANPIVIPLLSIMSAYISNWLLLVLIHLQHIYNRLWERLR